ncbi:MAG TPA: hypothetical protein VEK32_22470, partial [Thermodesulfobacteriota bacterium]|nr:hypothetical protein [Thermodesulfobacteriota bacterium]
MSTAGIFALFALPLSMVTTFPIFIMEKHYGLIGLDAGIFLVIIVRFFIKRGLYKYRGYFWLAVLYVVTVTYFIALGPYHARPAWLVMCAIMAALFFGARAAVLTTGINAAILMLLYWLIGPGNQAWASEYAAPFGKWVMFVVNVSSITLASSGAAGFVLDRLDSSLKMERDAHKKLLAESEKLHAAHSALQAQEEELRRSEEALKRLAQENAVIAEIGRIINSTLNIEEVYEHFAQEVRNLISFDRISINTINPDRTRGIVAYAVGVDLKDKRPGGIFPLKGSLTEEVMRTQSGLLVQIEDIEE